jgi:hypothetical protein
MVLFYTIYHYRGLNINEPVSPIPARSANTGEVLRMPGTGTNPGIGFDVCLGRGVQRPGWLGVWIIEVGSSSVPACPAFRIRRCARDISVDEGIAIG